MELIPTLRKVPFFAQLPDEELESLAALGKPLSADDGSIIVREGDTSDSMYIIVSGSVRIFKAAEDGSQIDLIQLGEGDFFGELALLDNQPRSATAVATSPCQLFVVDQEAFTALVETMPSKVVFPMFSALTQRVRESSERFLREELEKQALRDQMEIENLRALAQMVAGVAHEINTPLGIINTAASVIAKSLNDPEIAALAQDEKTTRLLEVTHEALDLLTRSVERAHRLTRDFKKVSASQLTDTLETLSILDGIDETLNLFSINARIAKIEIVVDNRLGDHDPTWAGYRGYLSQVLMNLLTNIERYAYPDGLGGRVDLAVEADDGRPTPSFVLTVCDYGKGIDADHLSRVFEPFFTTGRGRGGTGLGMAIVHNIVTSALRGSISIESTPGEGTSVWIRFPQRLDG